MTYDQNPEYFISGKSKFKYEYRKSDINAGQWFALFFITFQKYVDLIYKDGHYWPKCRLPGLQF